MEGERNVYTLSSSDGDDDGEEQTCNESSEKSSEATAFFFTQVQCTKCPCRLHARPTGEEE